MRSHKSAAIFQPAESSLHRTVADLLDWVLYPSTVWTTFPAGWGKLSKSAAGRLKGSGLKAGFPDILIFHPPDIIENQRRPVVVGVELKVKGRKPSAAQQLMFPRLKMCGVRIFVCQSVDDVIASLHEAHIPLRSRCGWAQFKEDDHETGDAHAEARSAEELT